MPKPVDDMVDKMLADKSFYPKKTKEAREATAWAIAYSKYNKRKKKSYWIIDGNLIKTAFDVKIHQLGNTSFIRAFTSPIVGNPFIFSIISIAFGGSRYLSIILFIKLIF